MITNGMRLYNYFTFGADDAYGQQQLSKEPVGKIKMNINLTSQTIQGNINYKDSQYVGLTQAPIDDSYVIQFGNSRLKVLYVNSFGRFKQVFMAEI